MLTETRIKLCKLFVEHLPDHAKVNADGHYEVTLPRNAGTLEIDTNGVLKFFKKVEVLENEQDYYMKIMKRRFRDLRDRIATRRRNETRGTIPFIEDLNSKA